MSVGGYTDTKHYIENIKRLIDTTDKNKNTVAFGCSRGAATTLVSISKLPKKVSKKNIISNLRSEDRRSLISNLRSEDRRSLISYSRSTI